MEAAVEVCGRPLLIAVYFIKRTEAKSLVKSEDERGTKEKP